MDTTVAQRVFVPASCRANLHPIGALFNVADPDTKAAAVGTRASRPYELDVEVRGASKWRNVIWIGRDDLVTIVRQQHEGGIDHVILLRAGQQFACSATEYGVDAADVDDVEGPREKSLPRTPPPPNLSDDASVDSGASRACSASFSRCHIARSLRSSAIKAPASRIRLMMPWHASYARAPSRSRESRLPCADPRVRGTRAPRP